jgi:hypothetical protein
MHDRSAKFNTGFASTASRLYKVERNGAASAIDSGSLASAMLCEALPLPVILNTIIDFTIFKLAA